MYTILFQKMRSLTPISLLCHCCKRRVTWPPDRQRHSANRKLFRANNDNSKIQKKPGMPGSLRYRSANSFKIDKSDIENPISEIFTNFPAIPVRAQ